jgi:hypothetical protein
MNKCRITDEELNVRAQNAIDLLTRAQYSRAEAKRVAADAHDEIALALKATLLSIARDTRLAQVALMNVNQTRVSRDARKARLITRAERVNALMQ